MIAARLLCVPLGMNSAASWPSIATRLIRDGIISPEAAAGAEVLHAFGTLTGNSDMHNGNLSFMGEAAQPYALAPAYDMLPMAFAPRGGASLPDRLPPLRLDPSVSPQTWRRALRLAQEFVIALSSDDRFTPGWAVCRDALAQHVKDAAGVIGRLG